MWLFEIFWVFLVCMYGHARTATHVRACTSDNKNDNIENDNDDHDDNNDNDT